MRRWIKEIMRKAVTIASGSIIAMVIMIFGCSVIAEASALDSLEGETEAVSSFVTTDGITEIRPIMLSRNNSSSTIDLVEELGCTYTGYSEVFSETTDTYIYEYATSDGSVKFYLSNIPLMDGYIYRYAVMSGEGNYSYNGVTCGMSVEEAIYNFSNKYGCYADLDVNGTRVLIFKSYLQATYDHFVSLETGTEHRGESVSLVEAIVEDEMISQMYIYYENDEGSSSVYILDELEKVYSIDDYTGEDAYDFGNWYDYTYTFYASDSYSYFGDVYDDLKRIRFELDESVINVYDADDGSLLATVPDEPTEEDVYSSNDLTENYDYYKGDGVTIKVYDDHHLYLYFSQKDNDLTVEIAYPELSYSKTNEVSETSSETETTVTETEQTETVIVLGGEEETESSSSAASSSGDGFVENWYEVYPQFHGAIDTPESEYIWFMEMGNTLRVFFDEGDVCFDVLLDEYVYESTGYAAGGYRYNAMYAMGYSLLYYPDAEGGYITIEVDGSDEELWYKAG